MAWALLVLAFSTRTEIRGEPFVWVSLSWSQALRIALSQWTAWAMLSILIVAIDRRLPVSRDGLIRRFLFHIPLSLVFTVAYTYLHYGGLTLLDAPRDPSILAGGVMTTAWRVIHRNTTFLYWVIVGAYLVLNYQSHLKDRQVKNADLERLLSNARLETLRSQLQPHFLFNALNAISASVEQQPRRARLMLEQLGDLLRLSLEHADDQEIALAQELAFIDRYLQLQQVRFEDRLATTVVPAADTLAALVPPFILQPLVENAVRYGSESTNNVVRVESWRSNGHVCLRVSDTGPGLPASWNLDRDAGIGLGHTRERLRRLYGEGHHTFAVTTGATGGVTVTMTLPFREA